MKLLICKPRGFCAGVVRAIETVERALELFGPPIYVKHQIVNNEHVVNSLKKKGGYIYRRCFKSPKTFKTYILCAWSYRKHI